MQNVGQFLNEPAEEKHSKVGCTNSETATRGRHTTTTKNHDAFSPMRGAISSENTPLIVVHFEWIVWKSAYSQFYSRIVCFFRLRSTKHYTFRIIGSLNFAIYVLLSWFSVFGSAQMWSVGPTIPLNGFEFETAVCRLVVGGTLNDSPTPMRSNEKFGAQKLQTEDNDLIRIRRFGLIDACVLCVRTWKLCRLSIEIGLHAFWHSSQLRWVFSNFFLERRW